MADFNRLRDQVFVSFDTHSRGPGGEGPNEPWSGLWMLLPLLCIGIPALIAGGVISEVLQFFEVNKRLALGIGAVTAVAIMARFIEFK